jgi:secreted Zn-dependent insulinase-like peptidase
MYERLFDTLRTKEQLGYSVSCDYTTTEGIVGFYVLIQVL